MKQIFTVLFTIFVYIGSLGIIDSSIAAGHHDHGKRENHKILFHDIDMDKQQREEVKVIMSEQIEKGEAILESIKEEHEIQMEVVKTETRDRLSSVLNIEQMNQFDKNANRAKTNMSKMKKKMNKKRKKYMKNNKKDHREKT